MPMYHYRCGRCSKTFPRLFKAGKQPAEVVCNQQEGPDPWMCQGKAVRDVGAPTTKIVEVRDNGNMGRKVEQLGDAERLFKERSQIPESKFRKF